MRNDSELNNFIEEIMAISVHNMGGARGSVFGSSDTVGEVLFSLKQSLAKFVAEFSQQPLRLNELTEAADEIAGFLQTLQIMSIMSQQNTDKLLDRLQALTSKAVV